ncbi:MAG: hypothetical protein IMF13_07190, partial [Proteobacteria bacterium]|nr:hypothetical protein [Pseudomonadota bacterium]
EKEILREKQHHPGNHNRGDQQQHNNLSPGEFNLGQGISGQPPHDDDTEHGKGKNLDYIGIRLEHCGFSKRPGGGPHVLRQLARCLEIPKLFIRDTRVDEEGQIVPQGPSFRPQRRRILEQLRPALERAQTHPAERKQDHRANECDTDISRGIAQHSQESTIRFEPGYGNVLCILYRHGCLRLFHVVDPLLLQGELESSYAQEKKEGYCGH